MSKVVVIQNTPKIIVLDSPKRQICIRDHVTIATPGVNTIKVVRSSGADGRSILSGSGAPPVALGANGDYYLNTDTYDLYGPKASGSWGSPISLVGPQGEQGERGIQGVQGEQGLAGAAGADGMAVRNGSGAPSAELGVDGDFYISTAANTIYGPKAGGSWGSPTSLVGPQGSQGQAGTNGTNGTNGTDGKTVRSGSGAPSSGLGVDGDFYINTSANTIYGPKASGSWGSPVSLVGPQGGQGEQGEQGDQGPPGGDWIGIADTLSYSSADSPTFVFTVDGDKTSIFYPGVKLKLTQSSTVKYFVVTASSYSSPTTTVSVYGGTDYTLSSGAISSPSYSFAGSPMGFPLDPDKWTVSLSDTSDRSQASPTSGTWYNLGSLSLTIPIGIWYVSYEVCLNVTRSTASIVSQLVTLSTANNAESNASFTGYIYYTSATDLRLIITQISLVLNQAAKTTYYLNSKTITASMTNIKFLGSTGRSTIIKAVCAYL